MLDINVDAYARFTEQGSIETHGAGYTLLYCVNDNEDRVNINRCHYKNIT